MHPSYNHGPLARPGMSPKPTRRQFLSRGALALAGAALGAGSSNLFAQTPGERPERAANVTVLNPRGRVPVSFIIDDSTCLVNLNRFAIPQFAKAWGNGTNYQQPWREMPHEIPDAFVRKFGEWCAEHGVRGKYSIVPYPACVGRVDRILPGWTDRELQESLELVRSLMMPHWDIHPEMITHTRIIDTKTGHPTADHSLRFMENWEWTTGRSVDEIADYMSYALRILKEVGLPCEGITTPGGFGSRALPQLARATLESVRSVFGTEIPHYFRHLYDKGEESVAPRVEYASGLESDDPKCVVSIIACTGDWTGGWDCSPPVGADRFITEDLKSGRMVDVIQRGEPALMLAHWTGIHFSGQELGFRIFQQVVGRLHQAFDHLVWMKLSDIARYWAAKELTRIRYTERQITLKAPFAAPAFTIALPSQDPANPQLIGNNSRAALHKVAGRLQLQSGAWTQERDRIILCFDLPKGNSTISI